MNETYLNLISAAACRVYLSLDIYIAGFELVYQFESENLEADGGRNTHS